MVALTEFPVFDDNIMTNSIVFNDMSMKVEILRFLKNADLRISDILVKKVDSKEISERRAASHIKKMNREGFIPYLRDILENFNGFEVDTYHDGLDIDGKQSKIPFDIVDESDGTRSLSA